MIEVVEMVKARSLYVDRCSFFAFYAPFFLPTTLWQLIIWDLWFLFGLLLIVIYRLYCLILSLLFVI